MRTEHLLIYLSNAIAAILVLLFFTAWLARSHRSVMYGLIVTLGMLFFYLPLLGLILFFQQRTGIAMHEVLLACVMLTGVWLFAGIVIGIRGFQRPPDDAQSNEPPAPGESGDLAAPADWRSTTSKQCCRAARWPAGMLLGIAFFAIGLHGLAWWFASAQVMHRMAVLKKEAAALALSVAPKPLEDSDNAYPLYVSANKAIPEDDLAVRRVLRNWREGMPIETDDGQERLVTLEEARAVMNQLKPALQFAEQAAEKPGLDPAVDYSEPSLAIHIPHLAWMRQVSRLFATRALLRAEDGDWTGALADVRAIQRMAKSLRHEPTIIGQLVHTAVQAMAVKTLERVLERGHPDGEVLRSAGLSFAPMDDRLPARGFTMEKAMLLYTISQVGSGETPMEEISGDQSGGIGAFLYRVFLADVDADATGRYMDAVIDAMAYEPHAMPAGLVGKVEGQELHKAGLLTRVLLPAFGGAVRTFNQGEAKTRLAEVAVAVLRHGHKHGVLPKNVADIDPAIMKKLPVDPFTGNPPRMVRTRTAIYLYFVGPNSLDDDAAVATWEEDDSRDAVFRIQLHGDD